MRPALIERVCRVCAARASVEPPRGWDDVLQPVCSRCFTPYLLTLTAEGKLVLLVSTMYSLPIAVGHLRDPIQIVCELAQTRGEVERVRAELHALDFPALAERIRVTELAELEEGVIYGLTEQVEASVSRLLRDAETGLLR